MATTEQQVWGMISRVAFRAMLRERGAIELPRCVIFYEDDGVRVEYEDGRVVVATRDTMTETFPHCRTSLNRPGLIQPGNLAPTIRWSS